MTDDAKVPAEGDELPTAPTEPPLPVEPEPVDDDGTEDTED